jgi:hypothetical protein
MNKLNKGGAIHKFYSIVLTLGIVALLIFAVPAQALTITLSPPSDPKVEMGEQVILTAKFNIKSDEQVPLTDLYLKIGTNKICRFNINGTPTDDCYGVKIDVLKFDTSYQEGNNTFKFKGKKYDYGYGYGFGATHSGDGEIEYQFTIDTKNLKIGKYDVMAQARFGKMKLTSGTQKFEIIKKETHDDFKTIRINAGGNDYKDSNGNTWAKDNSYNTGRSDVSTNAIAGTPDDKLFQYQRLDPALAPELKYSIKVPDGTYEVSLYFAETFKDAFKKNKRVFDIYSEGSLKINDLDIYKEVGANTALKKTYVVDVNDGVLNIDFHSVKNNPKVAAIEVKQVKN